MAVTPSDGVDDERTHEGDRDHRQPPPGPAASLMPEAVYTDTVVSALVTTTDAEAIVTVSYAWSVDGIPVAETGGAERSGAALRQTPGGLAHGDAE